MNLRIVHGKLPNNFRRAVGGVVVDHEDVCDGQSAADLRHEAGDVFAFIVGTDGDKDAGGIHSKIDRKRK
jgi:hypothetical protein